MNAFPPLTGPRLPLKGLGEGVRFARLPDLKEFTPDHLVAPVGDDDIDKAALA